MNKELILVSGKPGSGKTTSCRNAILRRDEWAPDKKLYHLTVGGHIRRIISGDIFSAFYPELSERKKDVASMKTIENGLVALVIQEYLASLPDYSVTLLDGYPIYSAQIADLQNIMQDNSAEVLGGINLYVSDEVAVSRLVLRASLDGHANHDYNMATTRVADYNLQTSPTVDMIANIWGVSIINGEAEIDFVNNHFITECSRIMQ